MNAPRKLDRASALGSFVKLGRRGLGVMALGLTAAVFLECGGSAGHGAGATGEAQAGGASTSDGRGGALGVGGTLGVGGEGAATTSQGGASTTTNGGVNATLGGSLPTGSTGAGMAGDTGDSPTVCGGVVCNALPNVLPDAASHCEDDLCVVPSEGCALGYGSCRDSPGSVCETRLGSETDCGACGNVCPPGEPLCTRIDGEYTCSSACISETPDFCNGCVNLATSLAHCGACDTPCQSEFNQVSCVLGECQHGDCYPGAERCTSAPECDSLNTLENCGACGRNDCGAENATPDCTNPYSCESVTCNSGWANCDTLPDCETEFGSGCTPTYLGTLHLESWTTPVAAVAPDSVIWVAGSLIAEADLDPTPGTDLYTPSDSNTLYVTKLNANRSYAWSLAVESDSQAVVNGMAAGPSGSVLVTGTFSDTWDFDPGPGVLELGEANTSGQAFLACFSADGDLLWAHAWPGRTEGLEVASDASGGIYLSGSFGGATKDLDPGPGTAEFEAQHATTGFLVKLDADGSYQWASVRRLEFKDIEASADSVWTACDGWESGIWHFPSAGGQAFWPDFTATHLTLSGSVVTAAGNGGYFSSQDSPEDHLVFYGHSAGALLRMQDDGSYLGVTLLLDERFIGLVSAPGDGVVALTETGSVLGYELDGTSLYRFQSQARTAQIVGTPDGFLLVGWLDTPADMDPGPGTDTVDVGGFVSVFEF